MINLKAIAIATLMFVSSSVVAQTDATRINDLNKLRSAILAYYRTFNTFQITGYGGGGTGQGYMSFEGNYYYQPPVSLGAITRRLTQLGFYNQNLISDPIDPVGYVYQVCAPGDRFTITARLANPSASAGQPTCPGAPTNPYSFYIHHTGVTGSSADWPDPKLVKLPYYAHDLDGDSVLDANITGGPCVTGGTIYCISIKSLKHGNFTVQALNPLALGSSFSSASLVSTGGLGNFGGNLQRWYAYWEWTPIGSTAKRVAVAVLNLNNRTNTRTVLSPNSWRKETIFFGIVRDPARRGYPFIAPAWFHYVGSQPMTDDYGTRDPWKFLCIYAPNSGVSQGYHCGTGDFAAINSFPSFINSPQPILATNLQRYEGGFVSDINGDGWDDIHLPYSSHLYSIDGRKAVEGPRSSASAIDSHAISETFFNFGTIAGAPDHLGGRMYATWIGNPSSTTKMTALFSNPIGSFADRNCNLINGVVGFSLDSLNQFSHIWNAGVNVTGHQFVVGSPDPNNIFRRGDGYNKCKHTFSDGVAPDVANQISYSEFQVSPLGDQCNAVLKANSNSAGQIQSCLETYEMSKPGVWNTVIRDTVSGSEIARIPNQYLWAWSKRIMPDRSTVYLVEKFSAPTPMLRSTASRSYALVRRIGNSFVDVQSFTTDATPEVRLFIGAQNNPVGSSTSQGDLYSADIDLDGFQDIPFLSPSGTLRWWGINVNTGVFGPK